MVRCRATASRMTARSRSHSAVLPSMSVKRKVTLPEGRSGTGSLQTMTGSVLALCHAAAGEPGTVAADLALLTQLSCRDLSPVMDDHVVARRPRSGLVDGDQRGVLARPLVRACGRS